MIESVLSSLFTLENLLWINVGLAGGIMVGALPGLTGTMAMALLLPLTYGLASIPGVMLLLGVYCGSIYGGSITAILINTPGTPASAATSLDGYPMAQKGHGLRALHDALSASTIGGLFSCAVLLFAAPPIASFALKFGPAEYFALALFGLTIIASVGGKSQIKGLLMGFVGLLISCIGIDPMDGVSRFTFGINRMEGGIDTIPVLIGLFAITEIMAKARDMNKATGTAVKVEKEKTRFRDVLKYKMVLLKSSILGVFIGAVPGTGAAISSFLAYNEAKRTSKHPEEYGHGSEEAVVASESANNAVTGATLIPLLTLGIPGDTNTAVLLGALTMQGIAAGPQLFTQHGEWVYTIMLGLIAVNIFMYLQGRVFIRGFVNITRVPTSTLVPILVMLCVIGAYAIDYSVFNAIFMVGVGGGRALDTAKIAADHMGVRAINVPTSAATCAASAWLAVEYTDEGAFVGNNWTRYPPFAVIAELDFIVRDCPARLYAAGIVDAMAKYPEISYNIQFSNQWEKNLFSQSAQLLSENTYRLLLEHGCETIEQLRAGKITPALEDCVCAALQVTGVISAMACGGKQAAVSHTLYSYFCCVHPELAAGFLHGELVGSTLVYQLAVNGAPKEAQEALNRVLRALGMPTCLEELGLKETPEEADRIFAFLAERMPVETPKELQRLRGESDVLFHGLRDSAGKLQTKRGEAHETGI